MRSRNLRPIQLQGAKEHKATELALCTDRCNNHVFVLHDDYELECLRYRPPGRITSGNHFVSVGSVRLGYGADLAVQSCTEPRAYNVNIF